jgi:hypothetical protein
MPCAGKKLPGVFHDATSVIWNLRDCGGGCTILPRIISHCFPTLQPFLPENLVETELPTSPSQAAAQQARIEVAPGAQQA